MGTTSVQPPAATTAVEAVLPNTEGTTTEPTNPFAAMISKLGFVKLVLFEHQSACITGGYCQAFWVNFCEVLSDLLING